MAYLQNKVFNVTRHQEVIEKGTGGGEGAEK